MAYPSNSTRKAVIHFLSYHDGQEFSYLTFEKEIQRIGENIDIFHTIGTYSREWRRLKNDTAFNISYSLKERENKKLKYWVVTKL